VIYAGASFSVANTQTVGDLLAVTGLGITGVAEVTAWDGTNATVRVTFIRAYSTGTYVVSYNIYDTGTGFLIADLPELVKLRRTLDITVEKNRRIDLIAIGT